MFVSTKQMLLDAQAGHYAVGAFNIENLEFVMAVINHTRDRKIRQPWLIYRNGSRSSQRGQRSCSTAS